MRGGKFLFWATVVSLVFLITGIGFTQENIAEKEGQAKISQEAPLEVTQAPSVTEPDTQWLWGEVSSLDLLNNEITVNYLDYETDNEKEIKITFNDKTKLENINSLNDIKLHDTVSVDYAVSADGKYIVKNISVEKLEEPPAAQKENTEPGEALDPSVAGKTQ